jgi:hypothetical protein
MTKKFRKSDIDERIKQLKDDYVMSEEEINELIDVDGSLIDPRDNYVATDRIVKSKKTSDDFARATAQGPGAYYPWGGAYYGGYYTMSEDEEIDFDLDEDISKYEDDAWDIPDNLKEEIDEIAKTRMESLVDEVLYKNKMDRDFVKRRRDEADLMHDVEIEELSAMKDVYEKPLVARKAMHLIDLVHKESLSGKELAIILKYVVDNMDINKISEEERELIGDLIKYGEQGEQ